LFEFVNKHCIEILSKIDNFKSDDVANPLTIYKSFLYFQLKGLITDERDLKEIQKIYEKAHSYFMNYRKTTGMKTKYHF
jgi:hypothetical protein